MNLRRTGFILATAASLLASGQASAQWVVPLYTASFHPSTGSWASYTMEDVDHGKVTAQGTFRIAVVAKEGSDYWVEAHFTRILPPPPPGQDKADLKMLVSPAAPKKPKKTYMLTPMGLMDFGPLSAVIDQAISSAPVEAPLKDAGLATLTLQKKDYQVRKMTDERGWKIVYLKTGVGPYGVVKQADASGARSSTITLAAYGKHAKSELTGTPMSFPTAPGGVDIGAMIQKAMQQAASQQGPTQQPQAAPTPEPAATPPQGSPLPIP